MPTQENLLNFMVWCLTLSPVYTLRPQTCLVMSSGGWPEPRSAGETGENQVHSWVGEIRNVSPTTMGH